MVAHWPRKPRRPGQSTPSTSTGGRVFLTFLLAARDTAVCSETERSAVGRAAAVALAVCRAPSPRGAGPPGGSGSGTGAVALAVFRAPSPRGAGPPGGSGSGTGAVALAVFRATRRGRPREPPLRHAGRSPGAQAPLGTERGRLFVALDHAGGPLLAGVVAALPVDAPGLDVVGRVGH